MSGRDTPRPVAVCTSKDCRTAAGHAELVEALVRGPVPCQLISSRCLDVCRGPVVVVGVGEERPRVFRRVRRRKERRDLVRYVAGAGMSDRLRDLRVGGKRRRRAIARVRPR